MTADAIRLFPITLNSVKPTIAPTWQGLNKVVNLFQLIPVKSRLEAIIVWLGRGASELCGYTVLTDAPLLL